MKELYETRWAEFGECYESFEGSDIASLLVATGEWLELLLMDSSAVDAAMRVLRERVYTSTDLRGTDLPWRELFERVDEMSPTSAQFMVSLNAFAYWGLPPDESFFGLAAKDADIVRVVEAHVAYARRLHDGIPRGWGDIHDLTNTVLAAEARFRIDTERDVTLEQLAALAQINAKSIRNMLTPKAGGSILTTTAAGEIPHGEALRWLLSRESFKPSIWREPGSNPRVVSQIDTQELGEVVFVPVAKDGSWFDPLSCQTKSGYRIGPKGAEQPKKDYREALDLLARMPTPFWRRPNSVGNWGLVAGVSWQRRSVSDLRMPKEGDN